MDKLCIILFLVLSPIVNEAWRTSTEDRRGIAEYRRDARELRRVHLHSKRHMLSEAEIKKRSTTLKPNRENRKKPSGHLAPLDDEDMENDEIVSVAIGPPPMRPKFEKTRKKQPAQPTTTPIASPVGLVKNLLIQLGREFLAKDVDENFVFGQYLGNAMKNLTSDQRLSMQHEILEIIVKYQRSRGEVKPEIELEDKRNPQIQMLKEAKVEKKFVNSNDTEETWPDFSNLSKIVG